MHAIEITWKLKCCQDNAKQYRNSTAIYVTLYIRRGIAAEVVQKKGKKVKCTLRMCTGRTAHRGSRGIALLFLDHGSRRVEGSASRPGHSLPPGKTRYPSYMRLGGPHGLYGQVQEISSSPGFDPRTVQSVASRYTGYATRPTKNKDFRQISFMGKGNG